MSRSSHHRKGTLRFISGENLSHDRPQNGSRVWPDAPIPMPSPAEHVRWASALHLLPQWRAISHAHWQPLLRQPGGQTRPTPHWLRAFLGCEDQALRARLRQRQCPMAREICRGLHHPKWTSTTHGHARRGSQGVLVCKLIIARGATKALSHYISHLISPTLTLSTRNNPRWDIRINGFNEIFYTSVFGLNLVLFYWGFGSNGTIPHRHGRQGPRPVLLCELINLSNSNTRS